MNTDGDEIAKVAQEYGAEVMMRPSNLAGDKTSMFDVLSSEIPKITPKPTFILLLQPTSPFRSQLHINIAVNRLLNKADEYDSIVGVERVPEKYNPAQVIIETPGGKGMIMGKLKSIFSKTKYTKPSLSGVPISQRLTDRQSFPTAWIPIGSIYLFKVENLKKGSLYGESVMLLENEGTININDESDFQEAIKYLKNQNAKEKIIKEV